MFATQTNVILLEELFGCLFPNHFFCFWLPVCLWMYSFLPLLTLPEELKAKRCISFASLEEPEDLSVSSDYSWEEPEEAEEEEAHICIYTSSSKHDSWNVWKDLSAVDFANLLVGGAATGPFSSRPETNHSEVLIHLVPLPGLSWPSYLCRLSSSSSSGRVRRGKRHPPYVKLSASLHAGLSIVQAIYNPSACITSQLLQYTIRIQHLPSLYKCTSRTHRLPLSHFTVGRMWFSQYPSK